MMNRSIHFVCAALTLLVFSISSVAEDLDPLSNPSRVTLFSASSKVPYVNSESIREEKQVHSFRIPSLVVVDGVLVAIVEAHYDKPDDVASIDIVATYSVDNGQTWKTEVIIKNSGVSSVSRVVEPTVVVKDNKIYVLVGSFNKSNTFWANHHNDSDWDSLLVVGEVTTSTSKEGKKTASITWENPVSLRNEFNSQKGQFWTLFVGGTRTGLLMSNGTIVFPLQIVRLGNIFPTIMYSNDNGQTWTFARGSPFNDRSSEPSVVEWGDKLIMSCRREEVRRFYESSDMGDTWVESYDKLSRVWGNAPDRQGPGTPGNLIAVEIDGMRVMLFILPLNTKNNNARDKLNLWMTDNNRIFNVGQVSVGEENTGYSSLLYHGDKLYCAHEVNNGNAFSIVLATLDKHLERIKSTVKLWKQNDKKLSDLCIPVNSAASDKESKSCGENITTSGLVGWLSGDLKENSWKDAYGCVDAKVTNAIATPYGAKFDGSGAGALWPVSSQGQNQRYLFVNSVFTLAAIVSIHKVPEHGKLYPVMGVSWKEDGEREFTALSYNSNRKWVLEYEENENDLTKSWNLNRKYHVALSLEPEDEAKDNFCVYVDGERLQCKKFNAEFYELEDGIENFYIGRHQENHKDMKGYITVSNVMLYNRRLSDNEIMTLPRGKHMIEERTMTISPSATLSLTPSLSLDPSAHVSTTDATASSPRAGEQNSSAETTHRASSSAPFQASAVNEEKGSEKSANENTHDASTQHTKSIAVPPTKDSTVGVSSLPVNTTGDGGSEEAKQNGISVGTKTMNNSGGNPSRKPKDSGSAAPPTEQRTDSNTDTISSTSTTTPAPLEVSSNSDSGDASVSGLNPSHGAESKSDSPQVEDDEKNKSSGKGAHEDTQTALLQPDSTALPPKEDNTVSDPSMPVNPMGNGSAAEAKPKNSSTGTKTMNNSGGNPSRKPKDSGSAAPPTEQRTDSNTDTISSTSTTTPAPLEVSSNSDSGNISVPGLNPSHGAESKSDSPQIENDEKNKSSDSPYNDADSAYIPLTFLLLSASLGFATFC